jgi:hypothetical protein
MPEELERRVIRIPKRHSWAFFKQLMDNMIGNRKWVAGFNFSDESNRVWGPGTENPYPGQLVYVHWVYKDERSPESIAIEAATNEYWQELFKRNHEAQIHRREMESEKRLADSWGKNRTMSYFIMSKPEMTETPSTEMGGTPEPSQKCIDKVQAPLPSDGRPVILRLPTPQFPKINIRARVQALEEKMSTENFKLIRWVKLARKKGVPYFDPPVKLDPGPIESINCPVIPLSVLRPKADPNEVEKMRFGKYWDESFTWDLVSKKIAEVRMFIEDPRSNSSQKTQFWKKIMESEFKSIVQQRIGKEMVALVRQLQRVEWNRIIIPTLRSQRAKDKAHDCKLTIMTWYNPELPAEEKNRRLNTLDPETVYRTVDYLRILKNVPWPQSCHYDDDFGMTNEEWDSAFGNFSRNQRTIQKVPELHLHRRRLMAPEFWHQQREEWRADFVKELEMY